MINKLVCIVGESGSGKSTVANKLECMGWMSIQSYTTRPPRYEGETGHEFCTVEEYEGFRDRGEIAAYSFFNGFHYFCTKEQALTHQIYVVDFDGVSELRRNMRHELDIVTVYINIPAPERRRRMLERGDAAEKVEERIAHDKAKFANPEYDYLIQGEISSLSAIKIDSIIRDNSGGTKQMEKQSEVYVGSNISLDNGEGYQHAKEKYEANSEEAVLFLSVVDSEENDLVHDVALTVSKAVDIVKQLTEGVQRVLSL